MSGPKSGTYRVAPVKKREIGEQLEERLKQIEEKINQINKDINKKKTELENIQNVNKGIEKEDAEVIEKYLQEIKQTKKALKDIYEKLLDYRKKIYINDNIIRDLENVLGSSCLNKTMSLEQQSCYLKKILETSTTELIRVDEVLNDTSRCDKKIINKLAPQKLDFEDIQAVIPQESELDIRLKNFGHNKNSDIVEKQTAKRPVLNENNTDEKLKYEYSQLKEIVEYYVLNLYSSSRNEILNFEKSLDNIMNDYKLDSNYKLSQLQSRKEAFLLTKGKYDVELKHIGEQKRKFYELYKEYQAICIFLNEDIEKIEPEAMDMASIIRLLEDKIIKKREKAIKNMETRYVFENINRIMEELGYDIITSDYMTVPNRNIMHNIYDFRDKDVINVYTSDNGSIMFEVTGIKDKKELSSKDKFRIKESMDEFCPQYEKIKKALEIKKININNETLLPADAKFAKVIDLEGKSYTKQKSKIDSRRNSNKGFSYKEL